MDLPNEPGPPAPGLAQAVFPLFNLPAGVQRNIFIRVPDRMDVDALLHTNRATRAIVLQNPAGFNLDWLKNLSADKMMRLWGHCIDRDGRNPLGEEVIGRRELVFGQLTDPTVRATYPQTHLAIALLWALERKNAWFVDGLSSPVIDPLVPIHMTLEDALRMDATLFNAEDELFDRLGAVDFRFLVEGKYETAVSVAYHPRTEAEGFDGVARGVILRVLDVAFPPLPPPEHGAPPQVVDGEHEENEIDAEPPITLILGRPRGPDASHYRFVLGFRRGPLHPNVNEIGDEQGTLMLGINPHADSWDEMVRDCFHSGARMEDFISHLLGYPLVDMNQLDLFRRRPLFYPCSQAMSHVAMRLLNIPGINASLVADPPPHGGTTPLQILVFQGDGPTGPMDAVFARVLSHTSMAGVHDFNAYARAVRSVCIHNAADVPMARLQSLTTNHKSVTVQLLRGVINAGRMAVLQLLLADPHPHTPLTREMVVEVLIEVCQRGMNHAVPILLGSPVQLTEADIAETIVQAEQDAYFAAMPNVHRQNILNMLHAYVPVPPVIDE